LRDTLSAHRQVSLYREIERRREREREKERERKREREREREREKIEREKEGERERKVAVSGSWFGIDNGGRSQPQRCYANTVQGLEFKVWDLGFGDGFGVWGFEVGYGFSGLEFWGLGFGIWGLGFGVWGFGFWVLGFGFWVLGFEFWGLGFGFWVLGSLSHIHALGTPSPEFAANRTRHIFPQGRN
jgi:hypothetical protein